MLNVESIMLT